MHEWPAVTLASVCGKPMYGLIASATDQPVGPSFVRQTDIVTGEIDWRSVPYCAANDDELHKYALSEGDLLISRLGAGVGTAARVREPHGAVFAGYLVRFQADPEVLDHRFAGYVLHSDAWRQHVERVRSGAAQPTLNAQQMGHFQFRLPPLEEQQRIEGVLGALDDLIDTNRMLTRNLWSAAEAAFIDASHLAKLVPARDCIELRYGKGLPSAVRRPGPVSVVSSAGIVDTHDEALVKGPGVVVGRKGSVGTVTWVDRDFYPIDTAFYAESKIPELYCYFALRVMGLEHMNTDSAVPGLNRENALSRPFPRPIQGALDRFVTITQPLIAGVTALEHESGELARARDELLSLLLSGRVRVDEVAA